MRGIVETQQFVTVLPGDSVTLIGSGIFASASDGSGISVTSTSTLSGANAGNYTLTQPTGLSGTILPSANLGNLSTSTGGLTTPFTVGTTSYVQYVGANVTSTTLNPTTDTGATVTVNGLPVSTPVSLHAGSNTITVVVTPNGGGATQSYTLTVIRAGSFTTGDLVVTTYVATLRSRPFILMDRRR